MSSHKFSTSRSFLPRVNADEGLVVGPTKAASAPQAIMDPARSVELSLLDSDVDRWFVGAMRKSLKDEESIWRSFFFFKLWTTSSSLHSLSESAFEFE